MQLYSAIQYNNSIAIMGIETVCNYKYFYNVKYGMKTTTTSEKTRNATESF